MIDHTPKRATIEDLPVTDSGGLRVELIPMPSGDNPWRTRADYKQEQRRDTIRFWLTIGSLMVSIISVTATAVIAIVTIRSAG